MWYLEFVLVWIDAGVIIALLLGAFLDHANDFMGEDH